MAASPSASPQTSEESYPNPRVAACYETDGRHLSAAYIELSWMMTLTQWTLLALSLGVLAFPFPGFYSRRHSYRALVELDIERRNESWWRVWRRVARFPWHWAELVRGLGATWFAVTILDQAATDWPRYAEIAHWARPVIPLVAAHLSVVLSGLLFRSPGKQPAPVFFIGAVVLTALPLAVAWPAVLLAGAMTLALKSLPAFFLVLGLVVLGLGTAIDQEPWPGLTGFLVAIAPVLIAAGRHQELLIPVHRSRHRTVSGESEHKH